MEKKNKGSPKKENENKDLTTSDESLYNSENRPSFDIRSLMDYKQIRGILLSHPGELSLFEISCILINKELNKES
jgi:hypothetical protein